MARKQRYRPGRTLVGLLPRLAIVLRAGRPGRHLEARARPGPPGRHPDHPDRQGRPVSAESLDEAREIIDQRVNGSGVAEAEVTTQGNKFIVVEIPGESRRDLVETVERQAQLRFRLVACSDSSRRACAGSPGPTPTSPTRRRPEREPSPTARHRRHRPPAADRRGSADAEGTGTATPRTARPTSGSPTSRPATERGAGHDPTATSRPTTPPDGVASRPAAPTAEHAGGEATRRRRRWPGWTTPTPRSIERSTRSPARRRHRARQPSSRRPRQAAGHLRADPDDRHVRSSCCRPAMIEGTDLDRRRRRGIAAEPGRAGVVNLDFDGAGTDDVHRDLAGALRRHRAAVRHRARRPGASPRRPWTA